MRILETRVNALGFEEAQRAVAAMVVERRGSYVCPATVFSVMLAVDNAAFRGIVNRAALVTADGMPLVWILRWLGYPAERVHNDDLFLACCSRFREWKHFLVGGRADQPDHVRTVLESRYPGIRIVGAHPTPVRPVPEADTERIVAAIRIAQPDIVWVGMGTPAQDVWMNTVADTIKLPMAGVGSVFDLLAGRTRPAPEWVKRTGLQWLYRFAQEPRRLARRYLVYNPRFMAAIALAAITGRLKRA